MAYQASAVAMQGEEKLRKGPWHEDEDERLTTIVSLLGSRRWDYIARVSGLKRSGKSCRLRWLNYLRPNIKHGDISSEEEEIIIQLHERWGNKWARIARRLPGRTDNEIKNYWRTHLRKKAQFQEEENFQCRIPDDNGKQEFLFQNSNRESCNPIEDINVVNMNVNVEAEISTSSYGAGPAPSDFVLTVTGSPYEARLTDWLSDFSSDQSEMESCCYYPEPEDPVIWGCPTSLWNMDY